MQVSMCLTLLHTAAAQVQSPNWAEAVCVKNQLLAVGRWFPPGTPFIRIITYLTLKRFIMRHTVVLVCNDTS